MGIVTNLLTARVTSMNLSPTLVTDTGEENGGQANGASNISGHHNSINIATISPEESDTLGATRVENYFLPG
jgi:hypothetical protein